MDKKYFIVSAKCGHVRKSNYIIIDFAVVAEDGKEAAEKVRRYKRVKHHHKDAIRWVEEVTFEEFMEQKAINDADPYLHCKNIQEQRKFCDLSGRVFAEKIVEKRKNKCKGFKHRKNEIYIKSMAKRLKDYWCA